jgi:hypothetical protein
MKLMDYQNEDAIELLADIIDPVSVILSDAGFQKLITNPSVIRIKYVQYILKHFPKEIVQIMARLDGVPVEEYKLNVLTIPMKLLDMINDKELMDFFRSQGQLMVGNSFGSATASTEGIEKA